MTNDGELPSFVAGEDLEPWSLLYERDGKLYSYPTKPRRLPLWERALCYLLDTLTRAVDAFTRWLRR